jgi:hypothetical protein
MAFFPNGQIGPDFTPSFNNSSDLKPATFTAQGGTAGNQSYNVSKLKYPLQVGAAADLKHYMVFFINIRGKSKAQDFGRKTQITPIGQQRLTSQGQTNAAAGLGGAAVGLGVGAALSRLIGRNGAKSVASRVQQIVTTGVGGAAGYSLFQNANDAFKVFVPDKTFRIDTAIMMAVNEKPSVKYGVDYDAKDLGVALGYLAGGAGGAEALTAQSTAELARNVGINLANIPAGIANAFGGKLEIGEALALGAGIAPNPFREQIFRNVDTRTFQFDYKFLPRSEAEAESIKSIIHKFKYHMHPEISTGGLFYVYPSTFDIAYYFNGQENKNIHKISTCVLERMSVDYGGQGFHSFEDGVPTEINMRLEFRELEVMTKERIEQGY